MYGTRSIFSVAFLTALSPLLIHALPIRVLFLGGGGATATHDADSMSHVMMPVMRNNGMTVDYHTNESVLDPDSLKNYDVMFIYNSKKGSTGTGGDLSPDLTTAQEDALYAWVDSGHVIVGAHCANSSYLSNPRYLALFGAAFKDHGTQVVPVISIVAPGHPSMLGVSAPPTASDTSYWDEDRTGTFSNTDTVLLSIITNDHGNPWTWVRPEGKGWVYYTSSGHDIRSWHDLNFQKQIIQALTWGAGMEVTSIGVPKNDLPTQAWNENLLAGIPFRGGDRSAQITSLSGKKMTSGMFPEAGSYQLPPLPAGAYIFRIFGTDPRAFKILYAP